MKKINVLFYLIGIICFVIAGYIVYDEFFDNKDINFNEDEELVVFNDKLSEIGSSLGWIVIVDGINNQDNGKYVISYDTDLFNNYSYRQLFVMEYILSNINNYELFTVLDMDKKITNDNPVDEFTYAYLKYNEYNKYYKSMFGDNFDVEKAMKANTKYDSEYVYYDNRRAGSNGVYVSMIQTTSIEYSEDVYVADVIITYSTKASELVGTTTDTAVIEYSKDINDNIILESFILNSR